MLTMYKKESLSLFVGTVQGDPRVLNREEKTVVLTLMDYRGECMDIYFKNRADARSKADLRADRILAAGVKDGAFLTVLATHSDAASTSATGIDFKFKGRWYFRTEEGKDINVLVGTACRPRSPREDMFCFSVPVDEYKNGQKTTTWYDVTFFNGRDGDRTWEHATFASRVMHNEENPIVVVAGGAITDRESKGNIYHSMVGYRITKHSKGA